MVMPPRVRSRAHPGRLDGRRGVRTAGRRGAGGPERRANGRASYRALLGVAEFRAIFVANTVSMLGNVVAAVALTVLIYQQTRSAALAASVMALSFLPYLLGGALLGVAERLPPRGALVAGDLLSGGLVAAMLIPGMPVAGLLALIFAIGLIAPVYQGVRAALLPAVLPPGPRYVLGRSMMRMVAQGAQIAGYGVGGLLLTVATPQGALLADAVSFAGSALVLRLGVAARPAPMRAGQPARDAEPGQDAEPGREGRPGRDRPLARTRAVLAHRPIRRILLFAWLVPACAVAPEALAAPYASHIGQPGRAVGVLLMGIPVGAVLADLIVARLLSARWQRRLVRPAALLNFVPLLGFAGSPALIPALGLLVLCGTGYGWSPGLDGLLLDVAPPELRNRALALESAGVMFIQGMGFACWGLAGQYAPLPVVIPAAAVAGLAVVAILRPGR
jgi:hypothetical protein